MKQTNLKLKRYAGNVNIVNNNNLNNRVFQTMLWSLGILVAGYVFILGSVIFNIVERKTLETSARNLSSEVGDLELKYLSSSKNIDLTLAKEMGFQETNAKQFSTRKALGSIKFVSDEL